MITTSELAILGTPVLGVEKMWRPSRTFNLGLPANQANNQIQQVKTVTLAPQQSQGVPQPVQNVSVVRTAVGSQYQLRVSFTTNPSDPYYQTTNVLVGQGTSNPVAIASGSQSPIVVTVNKTSQASKVVVQSEGRWGGSAIGNHPVQALSLK